MSDAPRREPGGDAGGASDGRPGRDPAQDRRHDRLHAKLRRLRREEGASPSAAGLDGAGETGGRPEPAPRRGGMPTWLAERLERRPAGARAGARGLGGRAAVPRSAGAGAGDAEARRRPPPPKDVGVPGDLAEERSERGPFAVRLRRVPASHLHGGWSLAEAGGDPHELALLAKDPGVAALDPRRAVYLDIETTGLSGGAGTTPYLVGLGWFEPGGDAAEAFVLWQGFLRGPEEEAAMLAAVAARVRASSGVVSFFGKSFDRHRLEDKMRVHGVEAPFAARPHLDLYHPLRRLYREALPDAKLQTMERTLCGVERDDDLPGSFAPAAWFDFLAGRAHHLEHVFRHNADDVLSLVVLCAHLACTLREERPRGGTLPGCERARAKALVRLFDQARRREEANVWLGRYEARHASAGAPDPAAADARFERVVRRVRRLGS